MVISTRKVRLLAATALALSAPALAACSTDMPTDKVYNQAVGTNERHASSIDVLNALVVSTKEGSGTFITTLVNNDNKVRGDEGDAVKISALQVTVDNTDTEDEGDTITIDIDVPGNLEIAAGESLVLANQGAGGIKLKGDFPDDTLRAGHFVEVTLKFDGADPVTLEVPVVTNSGYHEGEDGEPAPVEETTEAHEESEAH